MLLVWLMQLLATSTFPLHFSLFLSSVGVITVETQGKIEDVLLHIVIGILVDRNDLTETITSTHCAHFFFTGLTLVEPKLT